MSGHRILMSLATTTLAATLWGCPPQGPTPVCPPCLYKVSSRQLTGTMREDYDKYPLTGLVVTIVTNDGQSHTVPTPTPPSFSAGTKFETTVPTAISSKVSRVDLTWKNSKGDQVTDTKIILEP